MGVGLFKRDDGVTEDGEIGSAADAFDGILGVGISRVELGGGRRGKMAARGEAPDADTLGIEPQFLGAGANHADGALGVLKSGGIAVTRAEPVFEDEAGNAALGEPLGDFVSFVGDGQVLIAAPRTDNDGGAVPLRGGRKMGGQGWPVFLGGADGFRRSLGPEILAFGFVGIDGERQGEGGEEGSHGVRVLLRSDPGRSAADTTAWRGPKGRR